MRTLRLLLLWALFLAACGLTIWLGLDTLGILPGEEPQFDKVADLGAGDEPRAAPGRRSFLIKRKMLLEAGLERYTGQPEAAAAARSAMEQGVELFAKRDYLGAEKAFKEGLTILSSRVFVAADATATSTDSAVASASTTGAPTPPPQPTTPPAATASLEKELQRLEARLTAIKGNPYGADEAWLMLDRAFNSMMAGDRKNARYFISEADIMIDNLSAP